MEDKIHHSELTKLTGYDEKRFRQLAEDGWFPAPNRGVYQTLPTLAGIIKFLKGLQAKKAPALEEKKAVKLDFENREAERRELYETGQILTLREWEELIGETLPPIGQLVTMILTIEMPAQCNGMTQTQMEVWGKKKDAEFRREIRDAEKEARPEVVIKKRKTKGGLE